MTDTRPIMQGTGALFLALASVAEVALFYPLGGISAAVAGQPAMLIHVLAGSLAFAGILLFVFAPPSRRHERRVQLDRPVVEEQTIAPRRRAALPTTRGMEEKQQKDADKRKADARSAKTERPSPPEPSARDPPPREQPQKKAPPSTAPTPAADRPPPRPSEDDAPSAPADPPKARPPASPRTPPRQPGPAPTPPRHRGDLASGIGERRVSRVDEGSAAGDGNGTGTPAHDDDPVALAERLEDLDRQANQLKVQFALGKLSPRGYRHMLEEVDNERSRIETVLVEHQRFD